MKALQESLVFTEEAQLIGCTRSSPACPRLAGLNNDLLTKRSLMKTFVQAAILTFASLSVVPIVLTARQHNFPHQNLAPEEPSGFDNQTNGYLSQTQYDDFRQAFEKTESVADGLGPLFNDVSWVNCDQSPVTGGGSATLETRVGKVRRNGQFVEHPGGSLVRDHVIDACPQFQQHALPGEVTTKRASANTLGDGFIEAIADETIVAISDLQPPDVRGLVISVPILEAPGSSRVGKKVLLRPAPRL
jgi:hypothetical protein